MVNRFLLSLLVMAGLAGCETLGLNDKTASIEDRTAPPPVASTASAQSGATVTPQGAATGRPGVETAGLGGTSVDRQIVEAKSLDGKTSAGPDPRKDPASPLSKRSIYFDFDSFTVKDEYRSIIEAHASYMMQNPQSRVILQGNADSRGSREYNLALGQKRSDVVRRVMTLLGVQDERLEAISFGEEKPRALGDTEADYAENRRTDIVYSDE
ncbi:MAG: peptidoglycan-associated lipoprotein Pal [Hydrogenophilaceae bacterium]|nr:peptidoglycan-associated lipoprotein Pal [Hydrogenophilaceae bacterium]